MKQKIYEFWKMWLHESSKKNYESKLYVQMKNCIEKKSLNECDQLKLILNLRFREHRHKTNSSNVQKTW